MCFRLETHCMNFSSILNKHISTHIPYMWNADWLRPLQMLLKYCITHS